MAAPDSQERDEAAEYVLGTLDSSERAHFESRLKSDQVLMEEVAAWQRRFAPLSDEIPPAQPPPDLLERIARRIDMLEGRNVIWLKRRAAAWRGAAVAFAALAASLLLFVAIPEQAPRHQPAGGLYIAVLEASTRTVGFVATVDESRKGLLLRRVAAPPLTRHSYELWALGGGRKAPQPLGVIGDAARLPAANLGRVALASTTLAVSLEPPGGSPTGLPTGPILFTGKLLQAD